MWEAHRARHRAADDIMQAAFEGVAWAALLGCREALDTSLVGVLTGPGPVWSASGGPFDTCTRLVVYHDT